MTTPATSRLGVYLGVFFLFAGIAHSQVTNVSVSPSSGSSGSGVEQTFTATYSDTSGANDFVELEFLVNTSTSSAGACYPIWTTSGLWLYNDTATAWLGPIMPGSGATVQNSRCTLYSTGSSNTIAGNQATLTLRLSFTAAFAGSKFIYTRAFGSAEFSSFQQMGSWNITATGYPDLTIAKNHTGTFTQGQTGAYTLRVTNSGSAATSTQVTVTDTLPTGMTFGTMSGSGWNCTPPTCYRSDALAAGASYPDITLTVNVASNAASSLTNSVTVSGGGETDASNDTATDQTTINPSGGGGSNLAQGKAATQSSTNVDSPSPGASLAVDGNTDGNYYDHSVSTTNNEMNAWWQVDLGSSVNVSSVVVWNRTDCCNPPRLADYWVFISNTPFLATDTPSTLSSRAGTWNSHQTTSPSPSVTLSTGAGGYSGRYVRVQLTGQNFLSLAEVQVFGGGSGVPDLTITKTHSGNFTQGQSGTYTIRVTNSGSAATTSQVTVTDTVPAGMTLSGLSGTGWACPYPPACYRGDTLAAGASYPDLTLTANVAISATSPLTNTVNVAGGGETNTSNNIANDVTTISLYGGATWGTMATPTPGSRLSGSSVTFSWNPGSGASSYYLYVGSTMGGYDLISVGSGTSTSQQVTGLPTDGRTIYVRLWSLMGSVWQYVDYTYAAYSGTGTPLLTISKSHATDYFTPGQTGTYTITVSNGGSGATSGTVTISDTLPTGLTTAGASGGNWNCSTTSSSLSCSNIYPLAAGASYSLTATVNVANNAPGNVTNTATVSGGGSASNTASDPTAIATCAILAAMVSPTPGSQLSGSTATFNWNPACSSSTYYLFLGTTVGGYDWFNGYEYALTSGPLAIPSSGTLYVRLYTWVGSGWQFYDYTYSLGASTVPITITSSPTGRSLTVNGNNCTTPCTYQWAQGTSHPVGAATQSGGTGIQYVFANWSDGGDGSHSIITPGNATTYTANFTTQYYLTTAVNQTGWGTINPAPGWFNSGAVVSVSATASTGHVFSNFSGALTGSSTPQTLALNAPASVTANFTSPPDFAIEILDGTGTHTVTSNAPMFITRPTGTPITYQFMIRATALNGFSGTISFNLYNGLPNGTTTTGIAGITLNGSGSASTSFPITITSIAALGPATISFNAFGNNVSHGGNMAYLYVTNGALSSACSASPSQATVNQGATFTAYPNGGTAPYTYQWSGAVSGTGLSAFFASPTAGTFTATVTVRDSTNQSSTNSCSVTVLNPSGYTITAAPLSPQPIVPGNTASYSVTVNSGGGFNGLVSFSATGLPSGATVGFNPTTITGTGSTTMTVTTASGTPVTNSPIMITGVSGSLTQSTGVLLTMAAPAAANMINPPPGGILTDSLATFSWDTGVGASQYQLTVGSTPGGSDLYTLTTTSRNAANVPTGASSQTQNLYVTLSSFISGTWQPHSYSYATGPKPALGASSALVAQAIPLDSQSTPPNFAVFNDGKPVRVGPFCIGRRDSPGTCDDFDFNAKLVSDCSGDSGIMVTGIKSPSDTYPGHVSTFDLTVSADHSVTPDKYSITCKYDRGSLPGAGQIDVYDASPYITALIQYPPIDPGGPFFVTIWGYNFGPSRGNVLVCTHHADGIPCSQSLLFAPPVVTYWNEELYQINALLTPLPDASGKYDVVVVTKGENGITFAPNPQQNNSSQSNRWPISVTQAPLSLYVDAVNHDNPYNTTTTRIDPMNPAIVYGGSVDSTSDILTLTPSGAVSNATYYAWTVSGPGSSNYVSPPQSSIPTPWSVGRVRPVVGVLNFQLTIGLNSGGTITTTRAVEIGIRSDDVIVVGWIDRERVPDPAEHRTGVSQVFLDRLASDGNVTSSLACTGVILDLSTNCTNPVGTQLSNADRTYILYWMFRFANSPNPSTTIPGGQFLDDNGTAADEVKVANFRAVPTNYKLFNRLQVKWRAGSDSSTLLFVSRNHSVPGDIGTTPNPCGGIPSLFPGQAGPKNGSFVTTPSKLSLVNDGSPDASAISAFNTLTGKDVSGTAVFWENIGSQIGFTANGAFDGLRVVQAYPSYNIYVNGRYIRTEAQSSSPLAQFVPNPYPFGTESCINEICGITPGGRCGNASSPADRTARTPAFIVQ